MSAVSLDPQTDTGGVRCGKPDTRTLLWGGHRQDRMREDLWWQCLIALVVGGSTAYRSTGGHYLSAISNGLLLTTIGSNLGSVLANEMRNSFYFGTFN